MKVEDIDKAKKYQEELAGIDCMLRDVRAVDGLRYITLHGNDLNNTAMIDVNKVPEGIVLEVRRAVHKYLQEQRDIILKAIDAL